MLQRCAGNEFADSACLRIGVAMERLPAAPHCRYRGPTACPLE